MGNTRRTSSWLASAGVLALLAAGAPLEGQSGTQSDVSGPSVTGSGTAGSTGSPQPPPPPPPPPPPAVQQAVANVSTQLSNGTFTAPGGTPAAPVAVQQAVGAVLSGNATQQQQQQVATALGTGGGALVDALAAFGGAPSLTNLNQAIAALNQVIDSNGPGVLESPEFQTVQAILAEARAAFAAGPRARVRVPVPVAGAIPAEARAAFAAASGS